MWSFLGISSGSVFVDFHKRRWNFSIFLFFKRAEVAKIWGDNRCVNKEQELFKDSERASSILNVKTNLYFVSVIHYPLASKAQKT